MPTIVDRLFFIRCTSLFLTVACLANDVIGSAIAANRSAPDYKKGAGQGPAAEQYDTYYCCCGFGRYFDLKFGWLGTVK